MYKRPGAERYVAADYLSDRSNPEIVCSAQQLPFADEAFDTVVSTEVLEHVPEPAVALREMRRVAKASGHLVLTTPMYWPRHEAPYDFYRYSYDGLLRLLRDGGWEPVKMFNRGQSYAMLGQLIQHIAPKILQPRPIVWAFNSFFLWCDQIRDNREVTMGWTVVARPVSG